MAICEYDPTTDAIIELGFFRRWESTITSVQVIWKYENLLKN